ncbi:MAG: chain length determinant protein, partial [uncultured bacterium]
MTLQAQAQASHSDAPVFFDQSTAGGDSNDLMGYVRIIRKWLWAIVLLTILAGAVGWTVANGMPTIYSSTATLLIESSPSSQRRSNQLEDGGMVSPFGDNVQTQMEIMRSRSVSLRTVMQLRLWEQPEFDPRKAPA